MLSEPLGILDSTAEVEDALLEVEADAREGVAELGEEEAERRIQVINIKEVRYSHRPLDLLHKLSSKYHELVGRVIEPDHGCQRHEEVDFFGEVRGPHGSTNEKLCRALRVPYVGRKLVAQRVDSSGEVEDVVDLSWQVMEAHLFEVDHFPVEVVLITKVLVLSREVIAAVVAEPDVEAGTGQDEGGGFGG